MFHLIHTNYGICCYCLSRNPAYWQTRVSLVIYIRMYVCAYPTLSLVLVDKLMFVVIQFIWRISTNYRVTNYVHQYVGIVHGTV